MHFIYTFKAELYFIKCSSVHTHLKTVSYLVRGQFPNSHSLVEPHRDSEGMMSLESAGWSLLL